MILSDQMLTSLMDWGEKVDVEDDLPLTSNLGQVT